jgi:hypothetical protein
MRLKYITFELYDFEYFVVFPEHFEHSKMEALLVEGTNRSANILGAGEVSYHLDVGDDSISADCYGQSISMGVKSRGKADSAILNRGQG